MGTPSEGKEGKKGTSVVDNSSSSSKRVLVVLVVAGISVAMVAVLVKASELQKENRALVDQQVKTAEQLSILNKGKEKIQADLNGKEAELKSMVKLTETKNAELATLKKEFNALKEDSKNKQDEMREKEDELKEELVHQKSVNSLITEENNKQLAIIEENQKEMEELEKLLESQEQTFSSTLKTSANEHENRINEISLTNSIKAKEMKETYDEAVSRLNQKIESCEDDAVKRVKRINELEVLIDNLNSQVIQLKETSENEIQTLQFAAEEKSSSVEICQQEKDTLLKEKETLQTSLINTLDDSTKATEKSANLLNEKQEEIKSTLNVIAEKETELVELRETMTRMEAESMESENRILLLQTQIKAKTGEYDTLLQQREEESTKHSSTVDLLKKTQQEANQLAGTLELEKKAREELEGEVSKLNLLEQEKVEVEESLRVAQADVGRCLVERAEETRLAMEMKVEVEESLKLAKADVGRCLEERAEDARLAEDMKVKMEEECNMMASKAGEEVMAVKMEREQLTEQLVAAKSDKKRLATELEAIKARKGEAAKS